MVRLFTKRRPQASSGSGQRAFMRLAVLLLLCMNAVAGWATDVVFKSQVDNSTADATFAVTDNTVSNTANGITLSMTGEGNNNFSLKDNNSNGLVLANATKFTIALSADVTITDVKIEYTGNNRALSNDICKVSSGSLTTSEATASWTGIGSTNANLTASSESTFGCRIKKITVTYEAGDPTPVLSFGDSNSATYYLGTENITFPTISSITLSGADKTSDLGSKVTYSIVDNGTGLTLNSDNTGFDNATPTGVGTATITASIAAEEGQYKAATASYTITVSKKSYDAVNVAYTMTEGATVDLTSLVTVKAGGETVTGVTPTFTVDKSSTSYISLGEDGKTLTASAQTPANTTAKVNVTIPATTEYEATTGTINITVTESTLPEVEISVADKTVTKLYTFNPTVNYVKIKNADGTEEILTDYTITYTVPTDKAKDESTWKANDDGTLTSFNDGGEYTITATVAPEAGVHKGGSTTFTVTVLGSADPAVVSNQEGTVTDYGDNKDYTFAVSYTILKGQTLSPTFYLSCNGDRIALPMDHIFLDATTGSSISNIVDSNRDITTDEWQHGGTESFHSFDEWILTGKAAGTGTVQLKIRDNRDSDDSPDGKLLKETTIYITITVLDVDEIAAPTLPESWSKEYESTITGENITITNAYGTENSGKVYYTTDGSDPRTSETRKEFTSTESVTIDKDGTTVVRAVTSATFSGSEQEVFSDVVEGYYTWIEKPKSTGETETETHLIDKKAYDAGDRIEGTNITMTFGGVYVNEKDNKWDELKKTSTYVGPEGVLSNGYSVNSENDALIEDTPVKDEEGNLDNDKQANEFKHNKFKAAVSSFNPYESAKGLPTYGNYFKFEPTQDGSLTIYLEQQGSIYTDGKKNDYTKLRVRPLYCVDERGASQTASRASTTSRLDPDWNYIVKDNLKGDGMYTTAQMQVIYDMYMNYMKELYAANQTDGTKAENVTEAKAITVCNGKNYNPIFVLHSEGGKTFAAPVGSTKNVEGEPNGSYSSNMKSYVTAVQNFLNGGNADEADNTGYFMLTEGYVQYTFQMKAGKTYFLFGNRTKLGITGFKYAAQKYNEGADNVLKTLELSGNATDDANSKAISSASGKLVQTATVNRSFQKGYWYSLVLPFSVSTTQLHNALCDGTDASNASEDAKGTLTTYLKHGLTNSEESGLPRERCLKDVQVLYFNGINKDEEKLYLHRYFHQMIPAGTPVFIRPNKTYPYTDSEGVTHNLTFSNVTVEEVGTSIHPVVVGNYKLRGSYDKVTAQQYEFVLLNSINGGGSSSATGQFLQYTGTKGYGLDAMSAVIGTANGSTGAKMTLRVIGFDDEDNGGTTGIVDVKAALPEGAVSDNAAIYNLSGQVVGHGLELYTLPKGVYITNGKKHIVR